MAGREEPEAPELEEFEDPEENRSPSGLDGGVGRYENTTEEVAQRELGSDTV